MTVLLVGCGYWGQNWAKTLARLDELGAICEPHPTLQAHLKAQYPDTRLYDNLTDALCHPGVDAVVVATPVVTHWQVARQCLLANKSVLVEKPLTMDPEEAEDLVRLADGGGLTLAVGHLLMVHPALQKLRGLIQQGVLGEILGVQCTRVNLGKIRNEENAWWSLAPHDLSILSLLLDEPLTVASASGLPWMGRPGLEDSVYATFQTSSGKWGSVHVSWLSPYKKHETVVLGTEKMAIFDDTLPPEEKLKLIDIDLQQRDGVVHHIQRGETVPVAYEMPTDLLTLEAQGFLSAARVGTPLPNDGANGFTVVKLLADVQNRLGNIPVAV